MRINALRRLLWTSGSAVLLPTLLLAGEALASRPVLLPEIPAAAATIDGSASVGVLSRSTDLAEHGCTASVVASTSGDVLVTAAHCVRGTGRGMVFAPGYRSGAAPYGTWVVTGAYAEDSWLTGQDPQADVAFLTVRPAASNKSAATVQSVVGGHELANAPRPGSRAQITGYVSGSDTPTTCTTEVYATDGYPSFDCDGFAGGTSGGPWISAANTLTGVIGGLHQGGCSPDTSYTSTFDSATAALLTRAERDRPADTLPTPNSDGC